MQSWPLFFLLEVQLGHDLLMLLDLLLRISFFLILFMYIACLAVVLVKICLTHRVVVERYKVNELNALLRVFGQHGFNDFFTLWRYRVIVRDSQRRFPNLFDHITLVTRVEGQMTEDHRKKHATDGPDVDSGTGRCRYFVEALRRHVGQRSCVDLIITHAGDTEVHYLNGLLLLILILVQDILKF